MGPELLRSPTSHHFVFLITLLVLITLLYAFTVVKQEFYLASIQYKGKLM